MLATPVTLDSFNSMPLLNSMFFEHALKLSSDLEMPILAQDSVDVKIKAWEVIRYKYKFFLKDKVNITVMPELGGPGEPLVPPIFGRSVNPIPTWGGQILLYILTNSLQDDRQSTC